MKVELTYQQMSYLRSLLHKDYSYEYNNDEETRRILLAKFLQLEKNYSVCKTNKNRRVRLRHRALWVYNII